MPIVRTPKNCGGAARIDGHRLTVLWVLETIEEYTPEQIAELWGDCPGGVTADEIREAIAWAEAHPEEVEADRQAGIEAARELRRTPGVIEMPTGFYVPPGVRVPGKPKS